MSRSTVPPQCFREPSSSRAWCSRCGPLVAVRSLCRPGSATTEARVPSRRRLHWKPPTTAPGVWRLEPRVRTKDFLRTPKSSRRTARRPRLPSIPTLEPPRQRPGWSRPSPLLSRSSPPFPGPRAASSGGLSVRRGRKDACAAIRRLARRAWPTWRRVSLFSRARLPGRRGIVSHLPHCLA